MTTNNSPQDQSEESISQTDHFIIWRSQENDGIVYHIELGGITLHLLSDEWNELVTLIKGAD